MAQENSVSFKCYLQSEGLNEVRRFGVDKDAVCNFNYLKGKLQAVFPSLQGRDFTVSWKDSDGDEVVISSDDELMIALTEQQTEVRKLYVSVKPGFAQEEQADGEGRPQHLGVTCDGCNKGVEGFRYKCIQCSDYDLCASCEGKGLHAQHYMIRMPVPTSWRPIFGKRLAHHLSKAAHRASRMEGEGCQFNPFGDGRGEHWPFEHRGGRDGHHGGHYGGRHYRGRHGGWLDTLAAYLNDWSLPDDDNEDNATEKKDDAAAAGPSNRKQPKTSRKNSAQVRYLEHIGKTVCDLLDPLGINVAVEVRTNEEDGNAQKSGNGNEKGKETEKGKENGGENVTQEQASTMEVDLTQDNDEESQSHSEHDQSPETEGWTVLSPQPNEQIPQQQTAAPLSKIEAVAAAAAVVMASPAAASGESSAPATSAQTATTTSVNTGTAPKQPTTFTSGNSVYPNLFTPVMAQPPLLAPMQAPAFGYPQMPPPVMHTVMQPTHFLHSAPRVVHSSMRVTPTLVPAPAPVPEPIQHAPSVKPHVAEAVEKMMSMGFSNDGGWLTQLLESKDGDIIKALDVLQPVKRS